MYRLRELERRDMAVVNEWRNDPELIARLGAPFRVINTEVDDVWFDAYMRNRHTQVRCAIVDGDDKLVGLASLTDIDAVYRCAEFHIMIGKECDRGRGAGTYALGVMLAHAFKDLNLHRVELTALSCNLWAQHLYEEAGFIREGRKRQAVYKNGEYSDLLLYSLLRDEYDRAYQP